jgi:hypothetical protein
MYCCLWMNIKDLTKIQYWSNFLTFGNKSVLSTKKVSISQHYYYYLLSFVLEITRITKSHVLSKKKLLRSSTESQSSKCIQLVDGFTVALRILASNLLDNLQPSFPCTAGTKSVHFDTETHLHLVSVDKRCT